MNLYSDGWGNIEQWPQLKLGDSFSIVQEIRENWFYECLRWLRLRRKPRPTRTAIHTVTQLFPDEFKIGDSSAFANFPKPDLPAIAEAFGPTMPPFVEYSFDGKP